MKLPYPEPTDTHDIAEHIRLLAEAINLNIAGAFPGMIVPFRGTAIPAGWDLCDGTKGTPDLRDRFVRGTGAGNALKALSGANTVTLTQTPGHTHTATGAAGAGGAHGHSGSLGANIAELPRPRTRTATGTPLLGPCDKLRSLATPDHCSSGQRAEHTESRQPARRQRQVETIAHLQCERHRLTRRAGMVSHGHGVPINAAGGGAAFSIMPLFYSLVYIRKG